MKLALLLLMWVFTNLSWADLSDQDIDLAEAEKILKSDVKFELAPEVEVSSNSNENEEVLEINDAHLETAPAKKKAPQVSKIKHLTNDQDIQEVQELIIPENSGEFNEVNLEEELKKNEIPLDQSEMKVQILNESDLAPVNPTVNPSVNNDELKEMVKNNNFIDMQDNPLPIPSDLKDNDSTVSGSGPIFQN